MSTIVLRTALFSASLLAGLHWMRAGSTVPTEGAAHDPAAPAAADRVMLVSSGDAAYITLAIPKSYKSAPDAPEHLLVFQGGLCVRDYGLVDKHDSREQGASNKTVVTEVGSTAKAFVAPDEGSAVIVRTRYDSRVDLTPGETSTAGDTVTGSATVTLVDPAHPNGKWRVTLENSRWAKDVVVLAGGRGLVLTSFLPRTGPTDLRVLDATGHETLHVPETTGETLRIDASPDGAYAAAEVAFPDNPLKTERGVIVFDLAHGSQWTYGWQYGSDDEPLSWHLQDKGILAVKTAERTVRFNPTGKKL